MFIFPDKENTRNLPNNIKKLFLRRDYFEVLKIEGCTRVLVGCFSDLLTFLVNFLLGDNSEMNFILMLKNTVKRLRTQEITPNVFLIVVKQSCQISKKGQ